MMVLLHSLLAMGGVVLFQPTSGSALLLPQLVGLLLLLSYFLGSSEVSTTLMGGATPMGGVFALLSLLLWVACYLANFQKAFHGSSSMGGNFLFLFGTVILLFLNGGQVWTFYILFEVSVFPIFLIILSGGSGEYRLEAGMFLFTFTVLSSLFLFFGFFSTLGGSSGLSHLGVTQICSPSSWDGGTWEGVLLPLLIFPFLVKFPAFFFHIWLPKAHVEAPVAGSMVLAGILLKMGGWGLLLFPSLLEMGPKMASFVLSFTLWGGLLVGFLCYRQKDLKILIAFSSVGHMALCIFSLFCASSFSVSGACFLMVGHGILSSLIFFLSSTSYVHTGSRSLLLHNNSGSWSDRFFFLSWVGAVMFNGGFPPFVSFIGEILIFLNLNLSATCSSLLFLNFSLSGLYAVTLMSSATHGSKNFFLGNFSTKGGKVSAFTITTFHWVLLLSFVGQKIIM